MRTEPQPRKPSISSLIAGILQDIATLINKEFTAARLESQSCGAPDWFGRGRADDRRYPALLDAGTFTADFDTARPVDLLWDSRRHIGDRRSDRPVRRQAARRSNPLGTSPNSREHQRGCAMDNDQSEIRREIESTRANLVDKISTLETRIRGGIDEVKRLSDVKYQVERRPWIMMALSAAAGYLMSGLILPKRRRNSGMGQSRRAVATGSLIGGIVSSVGVVLAREAALRLVKRWDTPRRAPRDKDLTDAP
jgi:ElaB/YqjD/DUF883 family membrane-anchored ribosome-binding protein